MSSVPASYCRPKETCHNLLTFEVLQLPRLVNSVPDYSTKIIIVYVNSIKDCCRIL